MKIETIKAALKAMKFFVLIFFAASIFISCSKKNNDQCTPVPANAESSRIASFCNADGINYVVDSNGIYYQIIDHGSGITPNANSVITVTYTAATLDGTIVDNKSATPTTAPLSQFIEGWRLAIPYIQKSGHIRMIIPSSLAYGCTGISNVIPPNAPLYYDVVLVNVQ